jgi:hypothetical protein
MEPIFTATLLRRHQVQYFHCRSCGLIRTEKPYWLSEAYSDAIADSDVGLVDRNIQNAHSLQVILQAMSLAHGRFVDIGGGYGLLTRMLRDKGFDAYSTDKHCQNLFAKGFEPAPDFKADALFAFEVMEHLEEPLTFLREAFDRYQCRTFIFSTLAYGDAIPSQDWSYYSFDSGQHITIYQTRSLERLAEKLGCLYLPINGGMTHLITDRPLTGLTRRILTNRTAFKFYRKFVHRFRNLPSRMLIDWKQSLER